MTVGCEEIRRAWHRHVTVGAYYKRAVRRLEQEATEGQRVLVMGMDDGHDIRPRREDRRMNEALEIKAAVLVPHRLSVQVELDDVLGAYQLRGKRAGDQEAVGIVRVTDADMAVGVDDLLPAAPTAAAGSCSLANALHDATKEPRKIERRRQRLAASHSARADVSGSTGLCRTRPGRKTPATADALPESRRLDKTGWPAS